MSEALRARLPGWRARLIFGALLLVFSELVVWQTPTQFDALEWAGLALLYVALAAAALDLIVRLHAGDVFSAFLVAGIYGLVDATLVSHITTHDLPLSLLVRPLAAQPLAFLAALAAFRLLMGGRAAAPLHAVGAVIAGGLWGIWVRWLPVVSDEPIPVVDLDTALGVTGLGLLACALLPLLLRPAQPRSAQGWRLLPVEWGVVGTVLLAALGIGLAGGGIDRSGVGIVLLLLVFMAIVLQVTLAMRPRASLLDATVPPRVPNLAAWLTLVVAFLLAGWAGYSLPGSGDSSVQSDLLFGMLTGFGVMWLPAVSMVTGVRAFIQITREGG